MRRSQVLQRALILAALAGASAQAAETDTGWPGIPAACHAELKPDWAAAAAKGMLWEKDSAANIAKLDELSGKICPDYLKRPNDGDAIRAFSASKAYILDHSPAVEKKGEELLAFLKAGLADYTAAFARVGIKFPANPCGKQMQLTQSRTARRLEEIRRRILSLTKTCFGANARENADAMNALNAASHAPEGESGVKHAPRGKGHGTGSDITGLSEENPK